MTDLLTFFACLGASAALAVLCWSCWVAHKIPSAYDGRGWRS